jgi:glycerol kinase
MSSVGERYVVSIDQGTASSRCLVFDRKARIVSVAQKEHHHHYPRPGWVEHDPQEIWGNVLTVVAQALEKAGLSPSELSALGIANQRETTVLWEARTGAPVHNAINWADTRTDRLCRELAREFGQELFREKTGLAVTTYFSGP